jgi:hypothetical protein
MRQGLIPAGRERAELSLPPHWSSLHTHTYTYIHTYMCPGTYNPQLPVLCSDPNDSSLSNLVHLPSGTWCQSLTTPSQKNRTQPSATPLNNRFPLHAFMLQVLRLFLPSSGIWILGGDGLLATVGARGGAWRPVSSPKGLIAFQPWAHVGFSPPPHVSLCFPHPNSCLIVTAVILPTLSAPPGVSVSLCLSLPQEDESPRSVLEEMGLA